MLIKGWYTKLDIVLLFLLEILVYSKMIIYPSLRKPQIVNSKKEKDNKMDLQEGKTLTNHKGVSLSH